MSDDKPSSSNNSNSDKCALCGRILSTKKQELETIEHVMIDGTHYFFDSNDCSTMFKRFRSVYGSKFNEILGQEDYISNPFWNKVIPREKD